MTTEKRKLQFRKNQKSSRQVKRDAGFILWQIWIKPSWRQRIREFIDNLKKDESNES